MALGPQKKLVTQLGPEAPIRRAFRVNLKNRRREFRISQKELGARIPTKDGNGLSQSWIQQLESPTGNEVPSLYQLELLAIQLNCTAVDLITPHRFRSNDPPDVDQRTLRGKSG